MVQISRVCRLMLSERLAGQDTLATVRVYGGHSDLVLAGVLQIGKECAYVEKEGLLGSSFL